MVATIHGRDQLQTATLAADRDGRMRALRVHLLQDCGAYLRAAHADDRAPDGVHGAGRLRPASTSTSSSTRSSRTRRRPTPTAAPGRPEATHLIERLVDRLADELGLDAAEVRRLNFATEFPYTTATGLSYDSGDYGEGARQGARDGRLRGLRGAPERGRRARQLPRHRALDLGRDLRARAVGRDEGDRRRRRRLGVVDRAPPPDRLGDGDHGLLGARPGPRDVAGRRSSRASSASRSTRSRSSTATRASPPTASAPTARARWRWAARRCS